jgi:hypothetical protein
MGGVTPPKAEETGPPTPDLTDPEPIRADPSKSIPLPPEDPSPDPNPVVQPSNISPDNFVKEPDKTLL